jgi:hypothetical protein
MEIRYVKWPVRNKVSSKWNTKNAVAEFPPDWLQEPSLKLKRLGGLQEQEIMKGPAALQRSRLDLLSNASNLKWLSIWKVYQSEADEEDSITTSETDEDDELKSESDEDDSDFRSDSNYQSSSLRGNDGDAVGDLDRKESAKAEKSDGGRLGVKALINRIGSECGWRVNSDYQNEECQLVSYSKHWKKGLVDCNELTAQEREIIRECKKTQKKEYLKFAHEQTVRDLASKPLVRFHFIFMMVKQCLTLSSMCDQNIGVTGKDF